MLLTIMLCNFQEIYIRRVINFKKYNKQYILIKYSKSAKKYFTRKIKIFMSNNATALKIVKNKIRSTSIILSCNINKDHLMQLRC